PIDFLIDHKHSLVMLTLYGDVDLQDILTSERKIASLSDIGGYCAIADLSRVKYLPQFFATQFQELATLLLRSNPLEPVLPRLALVAPDDALFFAAWAVERCCNANSRHPERARVFRTLEEAMDFLQLSRDVLPEIFERPDPL